MFRCMAARGRRGARCTGATVPTSPARVPCRSCPCAAGAAEVACVRRARGAAEVAWPHGMPAPAHAPRSPGRMPCRPCPCAREALPRSPARMACCPCHAPRRSPAGRACPPSPCAPEVARPHAMLALPVRAPGALPRSPGDGQARPAGARAWHCRCRLAMGRPARPVRARNCRRRPCTPLGASSSLGATSPSACHWALLRSRTPT